VVTDDLQALIDMQVQGGEPNYGVGRESTDVTSTNYPTPDPIIVGEDHTNDSEYNFNAKEED
jgi:hypothetical protein